MAYATIILLIVLTALSAFFSASETALTSLGRIKLRTLLEKKKPGAKTIAKLKEHPEKLLSVILVGNTLANISASVIATDLALEIFKSNPLAYATGIMTLILLIIGEIIPKSFAAHNKVAVATAVAKPLYWISVLLTPLLYLLSFFTFWIRKTKKNAPFVTEDELKQLVNISGEEGQISEDKLKMIKSIFRLDEISVAKIMTTKSDIASVTEGMAIEDLLKTIKKHRFSRIPVFDSKKERVIGIVLMKDAVLEEYNKAASVNTIMRKPLIVREAKMVDSLLKEFQLKQESIAVVVDKDNHVKGIVTIEDVMEEIVGEMSDDA